MRDKISIKWANDDDGRTVICMAKLEIRAHNVVDKHVYESLPYGAKLQIENQCKEAIMRHIHEPLEKRRGQLMEMASTIKIGLRPAYWNDSLLKPLMDLLHDYRNE